MTILDTGTRPCFNGGMTSNPLPSLPRPAHVHVSNRQACIRFTTDPAVKAAVLSTYRARRVRGMSRFDARVKAVVALDGQSTITKTTLLAGRK